MTDRTFSHNDVLRIYCNHLTDYEREKVREWFRDTDGDCFDLPDIEVDLDDLLDVLDEILDTGLQGAEVLRALGAFIAGLVLGGDEVIGEENEDIESLVQKGLDRKNDQCLTEIDSEIEKQVGRMITDQSNRLGLTEQQERDLRNDWRATREKWREESEKVFDGLYTWDLIVPETWENDVTNWKASYDEAVSTMFFVLEEAAVTAENIKAAIDGNEQE